ncbi:MULTISPECIES: class I SAM-dependent methyltransferase [Brevibacterium]|uniref:class I SAM-dependent methyltransferase n=1 Tax=Brevibacterium TaxID=1696 RepID=UPI0018E033B0|nr:MULTISPECIES: class I SAM-dependent methyltransferase [Brevibacterium]MBM6592076.1 class I SAM-dependent methyltransferase [Brevibacterium sp. RIT 803]MCF2571464.1 class I SAM-dependent methyltransferase [Brevibacterium sp. UCMA 11754]MCF2588037.1 class I SAM-dependent methyltransferase [Brevibacterium sp. UCMA 11752]
MSDGSYQAEVISGGYLPIDEEASVRANRGYWDNSAEDYLAEHGSALGDTDFIWCPEGIRESDVNLLGNVARRQILEVGCGAGQCSRWLAEEGAIATGVDVSSGMLEQASRLQREHPLSDDATPPTFLHADARQLPFASNSFDVGFSSYGALPFVKDADVVFSEVARVLRPGGRWAFSTTHPLRWMFPDVPGEAGLTVEYSYFDRTPYVEISADGQPVYAEHHRTMGDWVNLLVTAGFTIDSVTEPEWPESNQTAWGGWSPLRGSLMPGTVIFSTTLNKD